ncbi:MAG: hypothetical protein QM820_10860 [Minicystis sp.]
MSLRALRSPLFSAALFAALLAACGSGNELGTGGSSSGSGGDVAASTSSSSTSAASTSGTGGQGGTGGMPPESVDSILAELRADTQKALGAHAATTGWPVPVEGGHLFVSTDLSLTKTAGDHDSWAGTPMTIDQGFAWVVINVANGDHYKFTDGSKFVADPWARSCDYDQYGEISLVEPSAAHLESVLLHR